MSKWRQGRPDWAVTHTLLGSFSPMALSHQVKSPCSQHTEKQAASLLHTSDYVGGGGGEGFQVQVFQQES